MRKGFNALQHGLRNAAILLPDDDAEEFHRLRRDGFQTYRPRTPDEAACVEAMAAHQWRIARCRRWQAVYDAQTDALLTGDPTGLAGHICEPDPHRWMHKSMDCTLQESRLDRLLCRTRDKLFLLQKLRRNNLIAGAIEREPNWLDREDPIPDQAVSPPQGGGLGGNEAVSPPPGLSSSPSRSLPLSAAKGSRVNSAKDGGLGGNGGGMRPEASDRDEPVVPASDSLNGGIRKYSERTERPAEPTPALRATSPCKQGEEIKGSGAVHPSPRPPLGVGEGPGMRRERSERDPRTNLLGPFVTVGSGPG